MTLLVLSTLCLLLLTGKMPRRLLACHQCLGGFYSRLQRQLGGFTSHGLCVSVPYSHFSVELLLSACEDVTVRQILGEKQNTDEACIHNVYKRVQL